jgi:hypothetical protein
VSQGLCNVRSGRKLSEVDVRGRDRAHAWAALANDA